MTRKASSRPARKRASSCSSERSRRSGVGSGRRRGTAVATAHWNVGAAPTYRFSHLPIRSRGGPRCGGMRTMLLPLVFLALAAPARAAGPEIGVADDRVLMAGGAEADRVVAEWRANGVEVVRIFAQSTRVERWGWGELDASVARVRGAGMGPILTVVGPRVRPSKEKLAAFAGEVAARYGAVVDRYIVWNEPNLAAWLLPQATCSHGRCSPVAPHLYRGLVRAARPAIQAADPGAEVLIGAMSSRGQDLRAKDVTERPMVFLRALGCVDARGGASPRAGPGCAPATEGTPRPRPPMASRSIPTARSAPPTSRIRTPTTSTSRRSAGSRARSTGCSAAAGCWPRRRASASTSTSTATRRGRPAAARPPAAGHAPAPRPLPRRVGLPAAAAGQARRRVARDAGPVAAAGRLPRLARPAREAAGPVPVARRAAAAAVRRLAVG